MRIVILLLLVYAFAFVGFTALSKGKTSNDSGGAALRVAYLRSTEVEDFLDRLDSKEEFIVSNAKKASTITSAEDFLDSRFVKQKEKAAEFVVEHNAWYRSSQGSADVDDGVDTEADTASERLANPQEGAPSVVSEYSEVVPPQNGRKKVLVTGGAGFIGSHTAERLLARGDDVVIIDEMNDYYDIRIKESNLAMLRQKYPNENRLTFYRGDICDEKLLDRIFREERVEWVCHLAARAGVRASIEDPYVYLHSNVEGTTRLLDMAVKYKVKNFAFASSSSVYGDSDETYFTEKQVVDHPISPYAASKKSCEELAYTWHKLYDLHTTGLRFFTVYGPRGRPDMAPFKFIDQVSRNIPIDQYGDGTSSRDYIYVDDIVDGVVRAIDRPYGYEIFNLGRGNGTTLTDFLSLVEREIGWGAEINMIPFQAGDVPYIKANITKARKLLGYDPRVSLEEGIGTTIQWYMNSYGNPHQGDDDAFVYH